MKFKLLLISALAIAVAAFANPYGSVTINQPAGLSGLTSGTGVKNEPESRFVTTTGYRVQVYSSNNARIAKSKAEEIKRVLEKAYPNEEIYITYTSPYWKVRIGDFSIYHEAVSLARQISDDFNLNCLIMSEPRVKLIPLGKESK